MATIKVFDVKGSKELQCFDTLDEIEYVQPMTDEQKALMDAFSAFGNQDEQIE